MPQIVDTTGLLVGGMCLHYAGRKKTLILLNIFILSALLSFSFMLEPAYDFAWTMLWLTACTSSVPANAIYVSEIADERLRAFFIGVGHLIYQIGLFIGKGASAEAKYPQLLSVFTMVACTTLAFLVPESPHWLAMVEKRRAANKVYKWLRADDDDDDDAAGDDVDDSPPHLARVNDEFDLIAADARINRSGELKGLSAIVFSRRFAWRMIILLFLIFINDSTPSFIEIANAVARFGQRARQETAVFYSRFFGNRVFMEYDYDGLLRRLFAIVGAFLFLPLSLVLPRKTLIVGSTVLTLSSFLSVHLYGISVTLPHYIYLLTFVHTHAAYVPLLDLLPVEIFPAIMRDVGTLFYKFVYELMGTIEVYCTGITNPFCKQPSYIKIRTLAIPLGLIFTIFYLPETKDLRLVEAAAAAEEIETLFQPDLAADRPSDDD